MDGCCAHLRTATARKQTARNRAPQTMFNSKLTWPLTTIGGWTKVCDPYGLVSREYGSMYRAGCLAYFRLT